MSHITEPGAALACFAVAAPGLEPLVADELRALAAVQPLQVQDPEPGGVGFQTDQGDHNHEQCREPDSQPAEPTPARPRDGLPGIRHCSGHDSRPGA
jgi:hypothetical protein